MYAPMHMRCAYVVHMCVRMNMHVHTVRAKFMMFEQTDASDAVRSHASTVLYCLQWRQLVRSTRSSEASIHQFQLLRLTGSS